MLPRALRQLLPPEHGAWGFLAVAVIAGLGLAPTPAAALIAVGVISGVFARHAAQLALGGKPLWAQASLFAAVSAATWFTAWWWAPEVWPWLAGAAGLTGLQIVCAIGSRRHDTTGVLVGGVALALVGGAIAATTPASAPEIIVGAIIGYLIAITPLVRARRHPRSRWARHALAGHLAAFAGAVAAHFIHGAPLLLAAYFALLTGRCLWLTRAARPASTPKSIGLAEIPFLGLLILAIVLGVRMNC